MRDSGMVDERHALFYRLCLIVVLVIVKVQLSPVMLYIIPPDIAPELVSQYIAQPDSPWIKALNNHYVWGGAHYSFIIPRLPYAQYNNACLSDDAHIIAGHCPYDVYMMLDAPQDYEVSRLCGVIEAMQKQYPGIAKELHVMKGGTVTLTVPHYSIILGRKQFLKRFLQAQKVIDSPLWKDQHGTLDLRYHDGFAFKPMP